MEKNLVGRCGLYCGACSIYRAERNDEKLRSKIAHNCKCDVSFVRCNGCGSLTEDCWGNGCKIVLCLKVKGYDYCFECGEFEGEKCAKYNDLAEDYLTINVDIRKNLLRIKNGESEQFLSIMKERFKCPICHEPVSAWAVNCQKCGHSLKE